MERDKQSKTIIKGVDNIAVTAASAPYEVAGTAIDTLGARALTCGFQATEAIGTDVIYGKFYECDTSGGTYTEVDSSKYLDNGSRKLVDASATTGVVTVGVFGTKRYVKPYIDADTVADDLTVNVYPVLTMAVDIATGIDAKP